MGAGMVGAYAALQQRQEPALDHNCHGFMKISMAKSARKRRLHTVISRQPVSDGTSMGKEADPPRLKFAAFRLCKVIGRD